MYSVVVYVVSAANEEGEVFTVTHTRDQRRADDERIRAAKMYGGAFVERIDGARAVEYLRANTRGTR